MSTSYVVMFIVAALVIVGDLIYELVRKPDDKASLSDLFDDCAQLPQEAIERAQAAGIKPTLIQVRTPPTENEREWGCNAAKVWLADNGLYMAGYNPEDQHHTAHIYRRQLVDQSPDSPFNGNYAVADVTSVWQKSKIERLRNDLQAIAA